MDIGERKLATVRYISEIRPIDGADAIECAVIDGWTVVIKKGDFGVGDRVIFCEIDSWIPHEIAPFLSKGTEPRVYNGISGERLKTVRLRGQLSQGLVLPMNIMLGSAVAFALNEGDDVTELLGIVKWERPLSAQLSGIARGNFPTAVPKTDQERIQNLTKMLLQWREMKLSFEITEKLDGSSCTMYMDEDGEFHVCSRNLDLKEDENNSFWKAANRLQMKEKMATHFRHGRAIQGELIGSSIQGNKYKMNAQDFRVFDVYDTRKGQHLSSVNRSIECGLMGLNHCPVVDSGWYMPINCTVADLLAMAEGKSALNPEQEREGLVFKCREFPSISFKVISNKFLLKNQE